MKKELSILADVCLLVSCGGDKTEPEPVNQVPDTPTGLDQHCATETSRKTQRTGNDIATTHA